MKKSYFYQSKNLQVEFEVNDWAERSKISLLTKSKDTVILTVINLGKEIPESDFLPLIVDYEEKFYASGKILGSRFLRRESKPTITSILNARLIDRSIRPLFSPYFRQQVHIVNTVLSYDPETEPALLSLLGTSFGIQFLKLPWYGPVAGSSLIFKNKHWDFDLKENNDNKTEILAELFISGTKSKINMIEFEGKELTNSEIMEGLRIGFNEIQGIINFIEKELGQISVVEQLNLDLYHQADSILNNFLEKNNIDLKNIIFSNHEGENNLNNLIESLEKEDLGEIKNYVFNILWQKLKKVFQDNVLRLKIRPDGRSLSEIRKLVAEIDILPRTHGSALFKRGLTHILSTVTLAAPGEELILRELEYEGTKHFIHHYNFPSYSTGELGSNKGPSRREIGHGELAEKSLRNLIPSQDEFPYTIRIVSEVLSSNGSTSMGSVCASSLALMAAGVPLKKHIAGISIGMAYEDDQNYELLTDIQGPEDFFGAMDFKIAGTEDGVTAIQLDVKIEGLNFEQIEKALFEAEKARIKIIDFMKKIIDRSRAIVSDFAPKVEILKIDPSKIGLVIGSGGRTINEIISLTNTKINVNPDGSLFLSGDNSANFDLAKNWIKMISNSLQIGEAIKGKVVKILPFGVVLELAPQKTALLHISDLDKKNVNLQEEFKLGTELTVFVKDISDDGRIYVSLKNGWRKR